MGRKMARIEVREHLCYVSAFEFDGLSMDEIIEWAQEQKDGYSGYSEIYLDVTDFGHNGGDDFSLMGKRMESDAEYEKRVAARHRETAAERARREASKKKEYEEYLRLKEKFEEA